MAKYKRSPVDIAKIKAADDPVISIGPVYLSLKRFHFALYRDLHKAFLDWSKSETKIARQNELFNDKNGISTNDIGGCYHSMVGNFIIGVPKNFPPIYSFAGPKDFDGNRICSISKGNTRSCGFYARGMYVAPTILIVHHFGDESIISKQLLKNPNEWKNLSFKNEPRNNEEFFMKYAANLAQYAFFSKVMQRDIPIIKQFGYYPVDASIIRDSVTGLMPDKTVDQINLNYKKRVEEYCEKANLLILDKDFKIY